MMLTIIKILIVHWIADFVLQDEEWALKKHNDVHILTMHVMTYTVFWAIYLILVQSTATQVIYFCTITGVFHFCTDYVTSKITHAQAEARHFGSPIPNFGLFTVVGFDQILHYIQLLLTYQFVYGQ